MRTMQWPANATRIRDRSGCRTGGVAAVIYQIYPRSYQDTSGDGVGDLIGIAERMPYIASLGVDAIWISPFFTSPMKDFGYDVSDYTNVEPMFGTLAISITWSRWPTTRHPVMIDLVLSHTSDQHPGSSKAARSRNNPKSDWYVWADPSPMARRPTTGCRSSAAPPGQWDGTREQYYLHNFLTSQPDLNFHNRKFRRPCWTWCASGLTAGRRLPARHHQFLLPRQGTARQSAARRNCATPPSRRRLTLQPPGPCL
jgi:glycosidase